MDISSSQILGILGMIFVSLTWWVADRNLKRQAIFDMFKDYRSPQMQYALATLWDMYRAKGKDNFLDEYETIYKKEKQQIQGEQLKNKIKSTEGSLDAQRRMVSQFYGHLTTLYNQKIFPKRIIFKTWKKEDLEIIDVIIIPMENKLREMRNEKPLEKNTVNFPMLALYNHAKKQEGILKGLIRIGNL